MIDHRKRFGGQMIALLTGTFFRWSIIGYILAVIRAIISQSNRFADHKSDHLPVKPFPMIDHLTAKLFPMIAQMNFKTFPMIDHRKQFEIHLSDHRNAKTMSMDELPPTELVIQYLLFSVIVFIMDFLVIYSPLSKCFILLEPICRTVDLRPICGEFFCLFLSPTDRSDHDKKPRRYRLPSGLQLLPGSFSVG